MNTDPLDIRERLAGESGTIAWPELATFFARGVVVKVAPGVTLLEAAEHMAADDAARVEAWLKDGRVARATDDDARDWVSRSPDFQCVVVAPWVLVQEQVGGTAPG